MKLINMDYISELYPDESDRSWIENIIKDVEKSLEERKAWESGFLNPYRRKIAEELFAGDPGLEFVAYGGFPGAKRVRLKIWSADIMSEGLPEVIFLSLTGNFANESLSDFDFLQLFYKEGIREDIIGDVLWNDPPVEIKIFMNDLPSEKIINLLKNELPGVQEVSICKDFRPEELKANKSKTVKGTIASMRLDAVASLGWGISRSKAANNVKNGLINVNWKTAKNPSARLKENDFISLRSGAGLIIDSLPGKSRKGRQIIVLQKIY